MSSVGTEVSIERLQAFLDDELESADREEIERALATDAQLRALCDDLTLMRSLVVRSSEVEADRVPSARFEQVWSEIERAIDRDGAGDRVARTSWWSRMRPVPLAFGVAAVAAAVVLTFVGSSWRSKAGPVRDHVSVGQPVTTPRTPTSEPSRSAPMLAKAPTETPGDPMARSAHGERNGNEMPAAGDDNVAFVAPVASEADIQSIEFGGKAGRIEQIRGARGTTTVIWVSEEETVDSERSL